MDVVGFYNNFGRDFLLVFLPWAGLVAAAAWVVRTGATKRFLPCVLLVWLATSAVFIAWGANSPGQIALGVAWVLFLLVMPQAGLLALLIRYRARPLTMLLATFALWIVQLPAALIVLLMASCQLTGDCL